MTEEVYPEVESILQSQHCEFCGRPTILRVQVQYTVRLQGKLFVQSLLVCPKCFGAFTRAGA